MWGNGDSGEGAPCVVKAEISRLDGQGPRSNLLVEKKETPAANLPIAATKREAGEVQKFEIWVRIWRVLTSAEALWELPN